MPEMTMEGQLYKLYLKREKLKADYPIGERIVTAAEVAETVRRLTIDEPVETNFAFFFAGNVLVGYCELHKGGFETVMLDTKTLFSYALLCGASSIVLAHNHPSGTPRASRQDIRSMKKLWRAGWFMGIRIHDDIIVSPDNYMSMMEFGLLPEVGEMIKDATKEIEDELDKASG